MVVRSRTIEIDVVQTAPKIKVTALHLNADKTRIKPGDTVYFNAYADLSAPATRDMTLPITLYSVDPNGNTNKIATRYASIFSGNKTSNAVMWSVTINKPGKWKFYAECPDTPT